MSCTSEVQQFYENADKLHENLTFLLYFSKGLLLIGRNTHQINSSDEHKKAMDLCDNFNELKQMFDALAITLCYSKKLKCKIKKHCSFFNKTASNT